jgi:polyisoprenoid-binding protein YceI
MNRTFAVLALAAGLAVPAAADTFVVDRAHSETTFSIRHLTSRVGGRFQDFSGTITGDPKKPTEASVEFTVKAASIDTDQEGRDKDLRSANFFDVEKFPEITFKSSKITAGAAKDTYNVAGTLTMHGVAKDVVIPVTYMGSVVDPWKNEKFGFEAVTTLNRKDFGIVWNKTLDNGGLMLSDEVKVTINLEAARKKDPAPAAK